jgi:hypothetical protein
MKHFMTVVYAFTNWAQIFGTCPDMVVSFWGTWNSKCASLASRMSIFISWSFINYPKNGVIQNSDGIKYKTFYGSNSCIYKFSPILGTCQHMVVSCVKCGRASVLALLLYQSPILLKTGPIQNSDGIWYKTLYGSNSCIYKFSPNWFLPTRGRLILGNVE